MEIPEKQINIIIITADKTVPLLDAYDWGIRGLSYRYPDNQLVVCYEENKQVYHRTHKIDTKLIHTGFSIDDPFTNIYIDVNYSTSFVFDYRYDKEYSDGISDARPIIYYLNVENSHSASFYRLIYNKKFEDELMYNRNKLMMIQNVDDDLFTSGMLAINLISHELREQAARRKLLPLCKLSDDQIYYLFLWLCKQLGRDVATLIYLFV